jgi:hypothetical protein
MTNPFISINNTPGRVNRRSARITALAEKCMTMRLRVRSAISIQAAVTMMFPRKTTTPAMCRNMCHLYGYSGRDTTSTATARRP